MEEQKQQASERKEKLSSLSQIPVPEHNHTQTEFLQIALVELLSLLKVNEPTET